MATLPGQYTAASPESTPCASPGGPPHWPSPVAARTPAVSEIALSVDTLQIRLQTQAAALAERLKALEKQAPQDAKPHPVHAKVTEVEAMGAEVQSMAKKLHDRIEVLEAQIASDKQQLEAAARIEDQAKQVEDRVKQLESLNPMQDAEVTKKIADVEARQAVLLQRIAELEGTASSAASTNGWPAAPTQEETRRLEEQVRTLSQREEALIARQKELERKLHSAEEEMAKLQAKANSALASSGTSKVTHPSLEQQLEALQQSRDNLEAHTALVEKHVHSLVSRHSVLLAEKSGSHVDERPERYVSAFADQRLPHTLLLLIKQATASLDRHATEACAPNADAFRPAISSQLPGGLREQIKATTALLDTRSMLSLVPRGDLDPIGNATLPPAPQQSLQVEELQGQIEALHVKLKTAAGLAARLQTAEGMIKDLQVSLSKETARCRVFEDENAALGKRVEQQRAQLQDWQFQLAEAAGEHTALKTVMAERDQYIAFTKQNEIELTNLKQQFEKEFAKLRREAAEQGRLLAEEQILLKQAEGRASAAAKAEKAALTKINTLERDLNDLQEKVALEGAASRRMSDSIQQSASVQEELRQTIAMAEADRKAALEAREAQLQAAVDERKRLKEELRETQAKLHRDLEAKEAQIRDEQRARESLSQQCDRLLKRMRDQDDEIARLRGELAQDRAQAQVATAPVVVQDPDPLVQAENVVLKKQLASSWGHVAKIQSQLESDREMWMKELDAAQYRAAAVTAEYQAVAATAAMRQPVSPEPPSAPSPQYVEMEESFASVVEGPVRPRPVRLSGRTSIPVVIRPSPSPSVAAPVGQVPSSTSSLLQSVSFQPRVVTPTMTVCASPQVAPALSHTGSLTSPVPSGATVLVPSDSASVLQPRVVLPEAARVVQTQLEPARILQAQPEPAMLLQAPPEPARILQAQPAEPTTATVLLQYAP